MIAGGPPERVEELPDRLLLYTADGDAALAAVRAHGPGAATPGAPGDARGRLPPAHRPLADRMTTLAAPKSSIWTIIGEYQLLGARRYWRTVVVGGLVTPVSFTCSPSGSGSASSSTATAAPTSSASRTWSSSPRPFLAAAALQIAVGESMVGIR